MQSKKHYVNIFGLFMMTGSMIINVYVYPDLASAGSTLALLLIFTGTCYFIPTALVSAELATGEGWGKGGVYRWVGEAFGKRWGFAAVFFQWFQVSIGFVTMLYFIIGALAYALEMKEINSNPIYKTLFALAIFLVYKFFNT